MPHWLSEWEIYGSFSDQVLNSSQAAVLIITDYLDGGFYLRVKLLVLVIGVWITMCRDGLTVFCVCVLIVCVHACVAQPSAALDRVGSAQHGAWSAG